MKPHTDIEEMVEEFYQHMLKSTPVLNSSERASLKLKFIDFLTSAYEKGREEERGKIVNKVKCHSFSEDPDFSCKAVLPISEMSATVKEPNTFYCKECYKRGLDMEYEAMGLR